MHTYLGVVTDVLSETEIEVQLDLGFKVYAAERLTLVDVESGDEVVGWLRALLLPGPDDPTPRPVRVETAKVGDHYQARVTLSSGADLAAEVAALASRTAPAAV